MAEKKGVGHAYNVDFLNVVFAASSLFLFLSVIWMVWDDYNREWKKTQRRFVDLEYQVTQAQLDAAAKGVDKNKLAQLQAQEAEQRKSVDANQQKLAELDGQLKDADTKLYRATLDYQYLKATWDQDRYAFEAARARGVSGSDKMGENAADEEKRLTRAQPRSRESRSGQGRRPEADRRHQRQDGVDSEGHRRPRLRTGAPDQAPRRHRAERPQGLLP